MDSSADRSGSHELIDMMPWSMTLVGSQRRDGRETRLRLRLRLRLELELDLDQSERLGISTEHRRRTRCTSYHPHTRSPPFLLKAKDKMGFRHNNVLHNNHFRKDWQRRVKVWFDQPGAKKTRRNKRVAKAAALGLRPTKSLRPAVRCPTLKYNTKLREGKGFTTEEIKAAGLRKKEARSIGIPVDHRRRNKSEESLKLNSERIKAYRERIVVLPRRNKKNKGTAPDLSSVQTTRNTAAAFPIPSGISLEKPRAITSEEKELDAFRTLREERAKHRNEGARQAREKKKEEEAAAAKK
ncbi:unnamed protein product [Sympodiomycopsis kandeliae]